MKRIAQLIREWGDRLLCSEQERFGLTPEQAEYHAGYQAALETCLDELREATLASIKEIEDALEGK